MIRTVYIDGVAFWAPALPGWQHARLALRGDAAAVVAQPRPTPALLGTNERRRAPDAVLVAVEVGAAAVADAGADAALLPSVFASTYGDLAVVDALCTTLAADPLLLSPTRFHHSVHNAASGYWAIATGCRAASSAVAGWDRSFGAGWLDAATLAAADDTPVLLVGADTSARGALASVNGSRGLLGVALVLAPRCGPRTQWRADWTLLPGAPAPTPPRSAAARALAANAMADALPLFEIFAAGAVASAADCILGAGVALRVQAAGASSPP